MSNIQLTVRPYINLYIHLPLLACAEDTPQRQSNTLNLKYPLIDYGFFVKIYRLEANYNHNHSLKL